MERKLKIDSLATKFITLGEMLANVYNAPDKEDEGDVAELVELERAHAALFQAVDAARLRKGIANGSGRRGR